MLSKRRLAIGTVAGAAFTLGLFVGASRLGLAAPYLPALSFDDAGERYGEEAGGSDETVIRLRLPGDREETKLDELSLRVGESKTVRTESGKDVTITKTEKGFKIKTGEKDLDIVTDLEDDDVFVTGDGARSEKVRVIRHDDGKETSKSHVVISGDGGEKKVVVTGSRGFAFKTGDRPFKSAAEMIDDGEIEALKGADARTKELVKKALEEIHRKSGLPHVVRLFDADEPGGGARITVERKKTVVKKD